jgi:hypothetical protein
MAIQPVIGIVFSFLGFLVGNLFCGLRLYQYFRIRPRKPKNKIYAVLEYFERFKLSFNEFRGIPRA